MSEDEDVTEAAAAAAAAAAPALEGGGRYCKASLAMTSFTLGSLTEAMRSGAFSSLSALARSNLDGFYNHLPLGNTR